MFKRNWKLVFLGVLCLVLTCALVLSSVQVGIFKHSPKYSLVNNIPVITVGNLADVSYIEGSTTPDYLGVTSTAVQNALNALPATGGVIQLISPAYSFSATVSRAIDNVTIKGMNGTTVNYNASTPVFSAGARTGWVFEDFWTDAGGVTVSSVGDTVLRNVNGKTPTGRTASYVIAASDYTGPPQYDVKCDGTADNVEINAAITAANNTDTVIQLVGNIFNIAATITMSKNGMTIQGAGKNATVLRAATGLNDSIITIPTDVVYPTIKRLNFEGNKTLQSAGDGITTAGIGTIIQECSFSSCYRDSIHVEGSFGHPAPFFVRDNIATTAGRYNFYAYLAHDSWLTDNIFGQSVESNVLINSQDVHVVNNNIFEAGWNGATYTGDHDGIRIYGQYNFIIGNFIDHNSRRAVQANDADYITISDNIMWSNNQSTDAGIPVIYIGAVTGNSVGCTITNNHLFEGWSNEYLQVVEAAGNTASVIFAHNTLDCVYATWGTYGFDVPMRGDIVIKDNDGVIWPGEVRNLSGSLTAGAAGDVVMAWQNPNATGLMVTARTYITTGGVATSTGDMGLATTVAIVEDCEDVWNITSPAGGATKATCAVNTAYVERGTNCLAITAAASIANADILAWEATGNMDLSTATHLQLKFRSDVSLNAVDLSIALDQTTDFSSPIAWITLPAITANTTTLVILTLNGGAAAGAGYNSVDSIGIRVNDKTRFASTKICYLDDIRAITVGNGLFNNLALDAAGVGNTTTPIHVGPKATTAGTDDYDTIIMVSATAATTAIDGDWYLTGQGE